jgi:hypothetical protein
MKCISQEPDLIGPTSPLSQYWRSVVMTMGLYHPLDCITNVKYKFLYFLTPNKKKSKRKALAFNRGQMLPSSDLFTVDSFPLILAWNVGVGENDYISVDVGVQAGIVVVNLQLAEVECSTQLQKNFINLNWVSEMIFCKKRNQTVNINQRKTSKLQCFLNAFCYGHVSTDWFLISFQMFLI